jgi:hypothetical protein
MKEDESSLIFKRKMMSDGSEMITPESFLQHCQCLLWAEEDLSHGKKL